MLMGDVGVELVEVDWANDVVVEQVVLGCDCAKATGNTKDSTSVLLQRSGRKTDIAIGTNVCQGMRKQ